MAVSQLLLGLIVVDSVPNGFVGDALDRQKAEVATINYFAIIHTNAAGK